MFSGSGLGFFSYGSGVGLRNSGKKGFNFVNIEGVTIKQKVWGHTTKYSEPGLPGA